MNNTTTKTKSLVLSAFFIAMQVVFTRLLSKAVAFLRVGFGFLPIAAASIMLGPIAGGICAGVADIIGATLFPQGVYFPGFTVSAVLTGVIYGVFMHNKSVKLINVIIPVVIVDIFINILLGTFWLSILLNKGYMALLIPRVTKNLIMIPLETFMIYYFWKYIIKPVS